ncbi:hypothetical protein BGZ54_006146 [Gamsiella multidivaricata]|nr:hypothetical protein BGZ54_006146 [Gamsiella multidivaricata]
MQHAQASEYLDVLESENQELKVQLLDINSSIAEIVNDIPSTNYIQTQPQPQPQSRTVAVYSTTSASSLHHPAASKLTPLDMDVAATAVAARRGASKYVSSTSSSSPAVTSTTTPSSPTSPMLAPILTHKSSLRYSKDSQVSPPTTDVALTFQ